MSVYSSKEQIEEWVRKNIYKIKSSSKFISRCIDGRYVNSPDLPALAIPGADAGEFAVILAAANQFAFSIDVSKTWDVIVEIVGGEKNVRFHTDSHADKDKAAGGCGHMKQMGIDPEAYGLTSEQVQMIVKKIEAVKEKESTCQVELQGDHQEGAVVLLEGEYGLNPQYKGSQIFIFHKTLVDARHKALAKKLIENKAVTLPDDCDENYLYTCISTVSEDHLMETAKRLAKGLPIYSAQIESLSSFKVENVGKVA